MNTIKDKSFWTLTISGDKAEDYAGCFILFCMWATPLTELFAESVLNIPYLFQSALSAACGGIGLIGILGYLWQNGRHMKWCWSDVFVLLLFFFSCISFLFTTNREITMYGDDYDEWLIHYALYYALMFAATLLESNLWKKRVLRSFVLIGALQAVISFFQCFGMQISYCYFDTGRHTYERLVYGLTQHCNFYVAVGILFTGAFAGSMIFSGKILWKCIYGLLFLVSVFCLLRTGTRLSWFALASLMLFYLCSFGIMRKAEGIRQYMLNYFILLVLLSGFIICFHISTDVIQESIEETKMQAEYGWDGFGNWRGYVWRVGLQSVPRHWLTGIGLDNYVSAFYEDPEWNEEIHLQYKGHNEYLHTLVTQGVFAAINYIALLIYACVIGVRTVLHTEDWEKRKWIWIFLGMFTGYACQAAANSSILNTAMYFWIVIGMVMPRDWQNILKRK